MLEGFRRTEIKTSGARIVTVHGGKRAAAAADARQSVHSSELAQGRARVWRASSPSSRPICAATAILRSRRAATDHSGYSFRAMAQDQVEVMAALGFDKFYAAGHDRGARVLHRMCLDHPEKVGARRSSTSSRSITCYNHINTAMGDVLLALVLQHPALSICPSG